MRVLLFAAGLGTRLRPLTDTMPKALVPVDGQPLLHHTLTTLAAAGAKEVVVNVHHFGQQIIDYVASHDYPLTIRISDERQALLDTGGGLRQALPLFSPSDAPILMHNVDILSNADLRTFYAQHGSADVRLMVSERTTQRYLLFDEAMQLVGWTNTATGEVRTPHKNLDLRTTKMLAFAGIHSVSPRLQSLLASYPAKFPIMDFYLEQCAHLHIEGVAMPSLSLLDVGKVDSLSAAEEFIKRHKL
ncbi:MAG: NTP transferase domain-containing protein [Bacteroidaceae bacterium]|nr:NTP transferase domain-containing protein [Bacteroidaceae bacterium]